MGTFQALARWFTMRERLRKMVKWFPGENPLQNSGLEPRKNNLAPTPWCAMAGVGRPFLPGGAVSVRPDSRTKAWAPGYFFNDPQKG